MTMSWWPILACLAIAAVPVASTRGARATQVPYDLNYPTLELVDGETVVRLDNSASCSTMTGALPEGCTQKTYSVPSEAPSASSGRGNPERGFYQHTETKTSAWTPVDAVELQGWTQEGYTLIYRNIILDTFVNTDLNNNVLQKIQQDFDTIRSKRMKVVLRFCYSIDVNNIADAPPAQLLAHIEQLSTLLQDNVDVIAVMQVGLVGVWGEWYYTSNYGNEGNISPQDWQNRKAVLTNLLQALDPSRQVQLRTPKYKMILLDKTDALTEAEAYTDTQAARTGHHNDCFLASDTDYGTYEDKGVEYPYLQSESRYVAVGGETCNLNHPRSSCPTALKELRELHYTYLNAGYHPDVLNAWASQGCFDQIRASLGYRLAGVRARFPTSVGAGGRVDVGVVVRNLGWAAPINYRSGQVVLRHVTTGAELTSPLADDDLRAWLPGDHTFQMTFDLPSSAAPGQYEVLLRLPDGDSYIQDIPEYNIVMENLVDTLAPGQRLNLLGKLTVQ